MLNISIPNDRPLLSVSAITLEHYRETLGIGTARPRISWTIETQKENWSQVAFAIEVYDPVGHLLGQTGRVESSESVLLPWPFEPLSSRSQVSLRVKVWGSYGDESNWSDPTSVEAGLLAKDEWTARFITPDWEEDSISAKPGALLRKDFDLPSNPIKARLYITALGLYEARINSTVVGDQIMAPGWTSYDSILYYQTYDVTKMISKGRNALGIMLGDGWYRSRLARSSKWYNLFENRLAALVQLEVQYEDGSIDIIASDESWRAVQGPVLASDIYDGETYDARLERPGWSQSGYNDQDWLKVRILEKNPLTEDQVNLIAPPGPPVRRIETVEPVNIQTSPSGQTILDFGQNLVGRLRFTVHGDAGQTITLRHAEVLQDGELCLRTLRSAKVTDRYILKGGKSETWEPYFTFHGFRYAEVTGWPGELSKSDVQAVVCHSDMERTGWFECSHPLINRLHENAVWSMRGNTLSVPTDCPQRDERMGWTGDIEVFSPTASFIYDCSGFLTSWLANLAADQSESGFVPWVIPDAWANNNQPAAAWGDAAVIIPWVLYQRFGDKKILADQYDSMCAWVNLIKRTAGESYLWDTGFQFGDWVDPAAPPDDPGAARTPGFIVATAYFAHSAHLLGRAAELLRKNEDAKIYLGLANQVRAAFNSEYVTPKGRVLSDSATAYALALQFMLLPGETQRQHAGQRLVELVKENKYRITTGFVGTPLICDALAGVGEYDTAFRLLTQEECPSWLYPVTMGATTIWERWDSLLPDGTVNPGEMTSFNHYALGAVADWLHRTVAGLAPAAPGYRRLKFKPVIGGGLTNARAQHKTPYGMAATSWAINDGQIEVEVKVPANTTAEIILPGKESEPVEKGSGTYRWKYPFPHLDLISQEET